MKVLLREYNGQYYVWKDATYSPNGYYVLADNGDEVFEFQLLAVADDDRIGYVRCAYCGAYVKNDAESIERHYAEMEAKKDCLTCSNLRTYDDKVNVSKTFSENDDGTYNITEVYRASLGCKISRYSTDLLNSESAKRNCKFKQCRRQGMREIGDTFVKYPGMFEKQITLDMLKAKNFKFERYINGYYEYDLKMRGTVKANVNAMGIVEHFTLCKSGWTYRFYYSDKYKKIFFLSWNKYCEDTRDWVTITKEEQIINKLSKLYEEAQVNE
jgi:hypothetical protein